LYHYLCPQSRNRLAERIPKFTELAHRYGRILSLKIASGTMIVITCPKLARDLLDVRGAVTGDRPRSHVLQVTTSNVHLAIVNYGPTWKRLRRLVTEVLSRDTRYTTRRIRPADARSLGSTRGPHVTYTPILRVDNYIHGVRHETSSIAR